MSDLEEIEQFIRIVAETGYHQGYLKPYQVQQFANRLLELTGAKMIDRKIQNPVDEIKKLLLKLDSDAREISRKDVGAGPAIEHANGMRYVILNINKWLKENGYGSARPNWD